MRWANLYYEDHFFIVWTSCIYTVQLARKGTAAALVLACQQPLNSNELVWFNLCSLYLAGNVLPYELAYCMIT